MAVNSDSRPIQRWRCDLHVYFGPIDFDSRMLKMTQSLAAKGFAEQIYLIGFWKPGLAQHQVLDARRQIRRFRLFTPRVSGSTLFQMLRLAEFSIRTLLFSFGKKADLVNCHMLVLLPICVLIKKLLSAQLVYEPREIESEQEGVTGRKSQLMKRVEKRLLSHANMVVHVGCGCARWYEATYGIKPVHVLNNAPYAAGVRAADPSPILRERCQIPANDLLFIYQGQLRVEGDIALILKVFADCPAKTKHVVFMGFGPYQGLVEEFARQHSNIHFLAAVPQAKILEHTAGADVGLCILTGNTTNNRLMNPNKVNEYFLAGIPMIVTDLPEVARFVREKECGWVIKAEPEALETLVANITREEVRRFRKRIEHTRMNFGWEQEERTLVRIYNELWKQRP